MTSVFIYHLYVELKKPLVNEMSSDIDTQMLHVCLNPHPVGIIYYYLNILVLDTISIYFLLGFFAMEAHYLLMSSCHHHPVIITVTVISHCLHFPRVKTHLARKRQNRNIG